VYNTELGKKGTASQSQNMLRRSPFLLFQLFAMQNAPMITLSMKNCKDGKSYALCRKPAYPVPKKRLLQEKPTPNPFLQPTYCTYHTSPFTHMYVLSRTQTPFYHPPPPSIPHHLTLKPTPHPSPTLTSPRLASPPSYQCPNNISVFCSKILSSADLET